MSNKPTAQWKSKYNNRMSTALLYCGTSEGFVIGADGRAFNTRTQRVESDTERKIFTFENAVASVVFAWSGVVKTVTSENSYSSLVEDTQDLLPQLDFNGLFAEELNVKLKARLRGLRTNGIGRCAAGIFLTYRMGRPWVSEITAFKNGRTWDCSVEENVANGKIGLVSGPDQEFEDPKSLDEAEKAVSAYLEDCVANPTNEIGGHIHIAKFTPDGFSWIRPPK